MISQKWLCMLQKAYNTFLSFFFFFIYMRNIQVKSFSIHFIDDSSFYLHASDDCMCDINLYSNIFQSLFAHNTRMQPSGIRCVCVCVGGFTIIYKSGSSLVYVEGMFNSVMYIQNIVQIVLLSFLQQEKANCFSVGSGDNAYPYNAYST